MLVRWLACMMLWAAATWPPPAWGEGPAVEYFAETKQTVRGEFLQFFRDRGGVELFGPPVSPELVEDGVRVQYFRNVRLEWHPDSPQPYRVQPGLLGELLGKRQPPLPSAAIPPANRADERYYPETGHTVRFAFLAFFDAHGGVDTFGYPISEVGMDDTGHLVQWFQRAQLVWKEDGGEGRIQLAPLGETAHALIPSRLSTRRPRQVVWSPRSVPPTGGAGSLRPYQPISP